MEEIEYQERRGGQPFDDGQERTPPQDPQEVLKVIQTKLNLLVSKGRKPFNTFKNRDVFLYTLEDCVIFQYLEEGEVAFENEHTYNDLIFGDSLLLESIIIGGNYYVKKERENMAGLSTSDRLIRLADLL